MALEAVLDSEPDASAPADDLPVDGAQLDTSSADVSSGGDSEPAGAEPAGGATLSSEAAALAANYGLDAQAFGSDANVYAAVSLLDRQMADWARQQRPTNNPASNLPQTAGGATSSQASALARLELDKLLGKGLPEDYDEAVRNSHQGVVGGLKAIDNHYHGHVETLAKQVAELAPLKEQLAQLQAYQQQQEAQRFESEVDGWFSQLGDQWKSVFGTGPMRSLPPGSPLQRARQQLVDQLDALQYADVLRGRPVRPTSEYAAAALRSAFPQQTETAARQKIVQQLHQRRNGSALARGNGRVAPKFDSPDDAARAALRAALQKHHLPVDQPLE